MGQFVDDLEKRENSNVPSSTKFKNVIVGKDSSKGTTMRGKTRGQTTNDPSDFRQVSHNYAAGFHDPVKSKPPKDSDTNSNEYYGGGVNKSFKDTDVKDISRGGLEVNVIDMSNSDVSELGKDLEGGNKEFELGIVSIRKAFESVATSDLIGSFDEVCYGLKSSLYSLRKLVRKDSCSDTDKLVALAYGALWTLIYVFGSISQTQQERNKRSLSRLLCGLTSQYPPLFPCKQMKEVESILKSLKSGSPLPSLGDRGEKNIENDNQQKIAMNFTEVKTSSLKGTDLLAETDEQSKTEKDYKLKTSKDLTRMETGSLSKGLLGETTWKSEIENDDDLKILKDFAKVGTSSLKGRDLLGKSKKQNRTGEDPEPKTFKNLSKVQRNSLELEGRGLLGEFNEVNEIENDDEVKTSKSLTKQKVSSLEGRGLLVETNEEKEEENDDEAKTSMGFRKLERKSLGGKGVVEEMNKQRKIENVDKVKTSQNFRKLETSSLGTGLLGKTNQQNKIENEELGTSKEFTEPITSSLKSRVMLGGNNEQDNIGSGDEAKRSMGFVKFGTNTFRNEGPLSRCSHLYKDKDKSGVTSREQDAPSFMPAGNAMAVKCEDIHVSYYQIDALKAVSTYFQKFGQKSYDMNDLPSPTPSSDGDNGMDDAVRNVTAPVLPQLIVSSLCDMNICSTQAVESTKEKIPDKTLARDGDSRLTFTDSDTAASRVSEVGSVGRTIGSKKQKTTDELFLNVPSVKRQKSEPTQTRTCYTSSLELKSKEVDVNPTTSKYLTKSEQQNIPSSLESILKEFNVDPRILVNVRKREQEKGVTDPDKNFTNLSSSRSEAINAVPPKSVQVEQKSAGLIQTPTQAASTDNIEKFQLSDCDRSRALRIQALEKVRENGSDNLKTSAPAFSSSEEIKNLEDSTHIFSVSQTPTKPPTNTQVLSPGQSEDVVMTVNNQRGTISYSQEVSESPSPPLNAFGDAEHLSKGFGLDEKQKTDFHKERARRIEEQKKMFAARKLCLVLDLDHTLLNSAKFSEVDSVHGKKLRKLEKEDRKNPHRQLFHIPHMRTWTKLRPGIWSFLEKASKLYEMHICTMGNKVYATEIAKLLDPKGTLFCGRVISRGNDAEPEIYKTKDLEGILGMESGVVIIDDSVQAWPKHKLNLIAVERYIYFPSSRKHFGLSGLSILESGHDENLEDGTLASSLAVIERIHQNFFAQPSLKQADVRTILASEQRKVLAGCQILFSGVFPIRETSPSLHPLWQTAEQFGARCTNLKVEEVTHVVANALGTDKVKWASRTGRFVVRPRWLEASAFLYQRANEQDFAV